MCVRERAAERQGCVSPPAEGETSWPYTSVSLISSVFKKGWSEHLPVISWLCQGCVRACVCVGLKREWQRERDLGEKTEFDE